MSMKLLLQELNDTILSAPCLREFIPEDVVASGWLGNPGDEEWREYEVHHIFPIEYGGRNDFWNLIPLFRIGEHPQFTSYWSGWRTARPIPPS